jgi:hypothetical protein
MVDFTPWVKKALIYKAFLYTHSFTLVINATLSTWLDLIELMSMGHFDNHLFMRTCQWVFRSFLKNYRPWEHIK